MSREDAIGPKPRLHLYNLAGDHFWSGDMRSNHSRANLEERIQNGAVVSNKQANLGFESTGASYHCGSFACGPLGGLYVLAAGEAPAMNGFEAACIWQHTGDAIEPAGVA